MTESLPQTSRRGFITGGAAAALGTAVMGAAPAFAQTSNSSPGTAPAESAIKLNGGAITQITMVVKNAEKVARQFTNIFGPSWKFYEFRPTDLVLHDQKQANSATVMKLALGQCGGHSFKLVEPLSGPSAYAEFLAKEGEGFYSIGLGAQRGYGDMVQSLQRAGVKTEMQGAVGDGSTFTILQTAADLGLRVEFSSMTTKPSADNLKQTGEHRATKPGLIDMDVPVLSGGRRFTQIGMVVKDDKMVARRYEEILGVTGWHSIPIPISAGAYRGVPLTDAELPSATVDATTTYLGNTQLELLCPNNMSPGGVHRHFLDKHGSGNGFQHLMISPAGGARDETLALLEKNGIHREWSATVHIGKMTGNGDYVGMEDQLGGFLLEFNG